MLFIETMPPIVILGMDFWTKFGIRPTICEITANWHSESSVIRSLTEKQQLDLQEVIQTFPTSENQGRLGRTNIYCHKIDTGSSPPFKQKYYPMSKFVLDDLNKEVDRMLTLGVIEEAVCCPWNNTTVAVKNR